MIQLISRLKIKLKSYWETNSRRKYMSKKRVLDVSLHKEGLKTYLKLKAAPEIEDYFRRAAENEFGIDAKEQSSKWRNESGSGLVFYKKSEKLSNKVTNYGPIMDNFGNGLLDNAGRVNLALLRIVGISREDGVTISTEDLLGYEETRLYIEGLASWAKSFYEENLRDQDFTASVTFEV